MEEESLRLVAERESLLSQRAILEDGQFFIGLFFLFVTSNFFDSMHFHIP